MCQYKKYKGNKVVILPKLSGSFFFFLTTFCSFMDTDLKKNKSLHCSLCAHSHWDAAYHDNVPVSYLLDFLHSYWPAFRGFCCWRPPWCYQAVSVEGVDVTTSIHIPASLSGLLFNMYNSRLYPFVTPGIRSASDHTQIVAAVWVLNGW